MRPCVRAFEHDGDARQQQSHILEELCQALRQPTGFMFHPLLTKKYCWEAKKISVHFGGNVGSKCTYITSNFRQNGPSDQPFKNAFSKN